MPCGSPDIRALAMAIDSTGAVTIAGSATNEQLPVTTGIVGPTCLCNNSPEAFLARVNWGGSQLSWATYVNYAGIQTLTLDPGGNVIIGGQAYSGFTATSGALQTTFPAGGSSAGFIAKIDSTAQHYLFATFLGTTFVEQNTRAGTGLPGVGGLTLDSGGTIWATGGSTSGLPLAASAPILGLSYIVGLSPDGSSLTSAMTTPEGSTGSGISMSTQGPVVWGPTGSILLPAPGSPATLAGIANSTGPTASGTVAPNELVSFYGVGLGPSPGLSGVVINNALTTSLGGVEVQFDGIAAPLLYAGSNQINAVVPSGVAGHSSTNVTIVTPAGQIANISFSVAPAVPEVFTYGQPGSAAIAMNQDWTLNSATNPAAQGSIVTVWASGAGLTGNPEVDGAITGPKYYPLMLALAVGNGFPSALGLGPGPIIPQPEVQYAGDAPFLVKGAVQVNFSIPRYSGSGSPGAAQFYLLVGGAPKFGGVYSDPFTVYVQ